MGGWVVVKVTGGNEGGKPGKGSSGALVLDVPADRGIAGFPGRCRTSVRLRLPLQGCQRDGDVRRSSCLLWWHLGTRTARSGSVLQSRSDAEGHSSVVTGQEAAPQWRHDGLGWGKVGNASCIGPMGKVLAIAVLETPAGQDETTRAVGGAWFLHDCTPIARA